MANKADKNKIISLASIIIVMGSFAGVRIINTFADVGRTTAIGLAFAMTVLLGVVILLLSKCESAFMGLLAAIIGYKMIPADIGGLKQASLDASTLYFIVQKAGMLLFILLIIRFYRMQNSHDKIKALPIITIMFAVAFSNNVVGGVHSYFFEKNLSMVGYYLISFACYIIATMVILLISYVSNYDSMRFAAYFQFVAMGINILRRGAVIVMNIINSQHTSKSYYCWIAIYAAIIVCFYLAKEKKKKTLEVK